MAIYSNILVRGFFRSVAESPDRPAGLNEYGVEIIADGETLSITSTLTVFSEPGAEGRSIINSKVDTVLVVARMLCPEAEVSYEFIA